LIEPSMERLLDISNGDRILDIGCGAGRFSRRMVELGAYVVACDLSVKFINRAKQRTPADVKNNIEYHVVDAADEKELLSLGKNGFDKIISTMAIMDMATITPMIKAVKKNLKPGGCFVYSILHPCFNSTEVSMFAEEDERTGRLVARNGVKIFKYINPYVSKGEGIIGQPESQYYFHRPLEVLFNVGFDNSFVINGFEEPTLKGKETNKRVLNFENMPEIPPILVVRMRLVN